MRIPDADAPAWVDGRRTRAAEAAIAADDPAFHAGLAVFETLAVSAGRACELDEHLTRLAQSAERLVIALPARGDLERALVVCASEQPTDPAWLKVVVTAGGRWFVFGGALDPGWAGSAASALLLPWRRDPASPLVGVKTTSYAENALGAAWARARGADEGLWCTTRGRLSEGCSTNLFVAAAGKLFTPQESEGILPGVVRAVALRAAHELGLPLHEGRVRPARLERAREAFLTSSLGGVRPLVEYERRRVGSGNPGPWTLRIARAVAELRRQTTDAGK